MSQPVLLVAGGSRGIGAAAARMAGSRGYDVAVNYNSNSNAAASVAEAVKKSGGKAVALQGDMGKEADIQRVFDETTKKLGPITHFVHSSGIIGPMSRLDEVSTETMREVLDVDTLGALICLRACVQRMSTKHGGKGGSIVMLSSMAAILGGGGECVWYAAAKGAIELADGRSRARGRQGGHPHQCHRPGHDRHRHPTAGPHGSHRADAADGQGRAAGRSRRSHPLPALGRGVLHHRREFAGFRRALGAHQEACAEPAAPYDRGEPKIQSNYVQGSKTWSRQCACTNTADPRS